MRFATATACGALLLITSLPAQASVISAKEMGPTRKHLDTYSIYYHLGITDYDRLIMRERRRASDAKARPSTGRQKSGAGPHIIRHGGKIIILRGWCAPAASAYGDIAVPCPYR